MSCNSSRSKASTRTLLLIFIVIAVFLFLLLSHFFIQSFNLVDNLPNVGEKSGKLDGFLREKSSTIPESDDTNLKGGINFLISSSCTGEPSNRTLPYSMLYSTSAIVLLCYAMAVQNSPGRHNSSHVR